MSILLIIGIAIAAVIIIRLLVGAIIGLLHMAVILAVIIGVGLLIFGTGSLGSIKNTISGALPKGSAPRVDKIEFIKHQVGLYGGSDTLIDNHGQNYAAPHNIYLPLQQTLSCKIRSRPILDAVVESCTKIDGSTLVRPLTPPSKKP